MREREREREREEEEEKGGCLFFHRLYIMVGSVIHLNKGQWVGTMSGVGAGLDSFYEYLLKVTTSELL